MFLPYMALITKIQVATKERSAKQKCAIFVFPLRLYITLWDAIHHYSSEFPQNLFFTNFLTVMLNIGTQ